MKFAATKQDENGKNKRNVVVVTGHHAGHHKYRYDHYHWQEAEATCYELGLILEGPIYLRSKTNAGVEG